MNTRPRLRPPSAAPAGVALVVTLLMMSVLVMMVVGLSGVMRNEQAAARNLTYLSLAEQLAQMGTRQGMNEVLSASPLTGPCITGPGWTLTNGVLRYLFSSNAAGGTKNLEELGTNSLILTLPDNVRGEIRAGWSNVVPPSGSSARPVGRFAFWVDDEGTKVNLNAVGSNNSIQYLPLLTNFPFSASYLFLDPATGRTNASSFNRSKAVAGRSNSFPSVESLKDTNTTGLRGADSIGPTVFRRIKGFVSAWSSNSDLTPWGAPKINLADPNVPLTQAQIKAALTTNAWAAYFGANASLGKKFGGGSISAGSHGDLVLDQIAMNLLAMRGLSTNNTNVPRPKAASDPRRHQNGLPSSNSSLYAGPYLEEVRVRVDGLVTTNGGSPQTYTVDAQLGLLVKLVNPYPETFQNYTLTVQPRKFRFGVTTTMPPVGSDVLNSNSGPPLNGFVGPVSPQPARTSIYAGPEWYDSVVNPWPLGTTFSSNNLNVTARSRLALIFTQTISLTLTNRPTGIGDAYVILDSVILSTNSTPPLVRDWVSADDFSQQGNFYYGGGDQDNGQINFGATWGVPVQMAVSTLPILTTNSFTASTARGLRKVDPRARFSLSYWDISGTNRGLFKAGGWANSATGIRVWTTNWNQEFTNTGISYLPADPVPGGLADLFAHPHFVTGYLPTNGVKSVAQLGAIHTGIPWRTLRLQPTPAGELAQGPPDWIVLDVFTATSPTIQRPMLNLNGVALALRGGGPGVVTNGNGTTNTRPWGLLAAMGAATTSPPATATNRFASNGVPLSLATNSNSVMTNLEAVASNLSVALLSPSQAAGWSTNSGWSGTRTLPVFPAYGMALRGEIFELKGVAEDTNNPPALGEDVLEGRTRTFLDLLTTRSDTFSIWSAGQALAYNTNRSASPIVMGEVRKQTVVQRVPRFDASGNVTGYELRILYTRNHTMD